MNDDVEAQIAEKLWPRIFARLGELALGGSDVPPAAQIKAAEMVHARLPEPEQPAPKEGTSAREKLAALLERTVGTLVPCPQCKYLVMEWAQACPRCGLLASAVSEQHMIKLREGRDGDDWQFDIFTWGMATANAHRGPQAITDESGGDSGTEAEGGPHEGRAGAEVCAGAGGA